MRDARSRYGDFMQIIRAGTPQPAADGRGHVLLIAGSPSGRRRHQVRPAENLHALAAVPASALLRTTEPADMVQLADSAEPQSVLTRLRAAAAAPGPLLVYLTGLLVVDRRGLTPHLALARTTAHTVRYTALPWTWLRDVLRQRPYPTVILADLAADRTAWPHVRQAPDQLTEGLPLYAVVTPPQAASAEVPGATAYTRRLAELLRTSTVRQPVAELHQMAAADAGLPPGTLALTADRSAAVPPGSEVPAPGAGQGPVPGAVTAPPAPPAAPAVPRQTAGPPTAPVPAPDPVSVSVPARVSAPEPGPFSLSGPVRPPVAEPDPHLAIQQAAAGGRHTEAAAMAAAWESYALRVAGPGSAEVRHWQEVRADLARLSGNQVLAAELWMAVARAHLSHAPEDDPRVTAAVDNAHHCWERVTDPVQARRLGPELVALRTRAPGPGARSLRAARRRLEQVNALPHPA